MPDSKSEPEKKVEPQKLIFGMDSKKFIKTAVIAVIALIALVIIYKKFFK